ncbi:hypothetical protein [Pannonibacter sp.]|uniref:hypothetical protein n=1 Tax=Pannonibacter sp. TaxID=1906786 RepID=UPI003F722633
MQKFKFPTEMLTGGRLPDQVFTDKKGGYFFFEFPWSFGEEAWNFFSSISKFYGEEYIFVRCIDPDYYTYYMKNFGLKAEFCFPCHGTPEEYTETMFKFPEKNCADAVGYRGDVIAWGGSSGEWVCWGERFTGLCIFQCSLSEDEFLAFYSKLSGVFPIHTLDEALDGLVSIEFAPDEYVLFQDRMREVYG